ncbi:hypothetical protein N7493_002930 [Penicillium malachiteum]|uniref:UDP-N-acetylglucosamine diphosphorylase n=1 Tax=Penicillium malachiteum TaxID=1324776 RepID=A0AAD6HTU0_9EURO|nr:hypothetical protein N7493_002930 [Penicillium malachiteum]
MSAIATAFSNLVRSFVNQDSPEQPKRAPKDEEFQTLREMYQNAGQGHVFAFADELSTDEKTQLFHQILSTEPSWINKLADESINPKPKTEQAAAVLEPLPESVTASIIDSDPADLKSWFDIGLKEVSLNRVAVVLMAGGQGTRLGSSAPKGCYDIGLLSEKSLFQLQAERIRKLQELAQKVHGVEEAIIPWYVMTSGPTDAPTKEFFAKNKYFGLSQSNVHVIEQGTLPCISNEGKIMLESKHKVAMAPDGNGGIYKALITSGARENMRTRGIQHIHVFGVDNCLVKVADPIFIGFSISKGVDVATKVVRKRDAAESVGLVMLKNGKPDVVEYSEIDQETREAIDPKQAGVLKFRAANIVNHYYSFGFLDTIPQWMANLPHHVARKKIPCINPENGEAVKPTTPNGIKLEQFIFDVFPMIPLEKFACLEVRREEEFSALKNARGTGEDDPDTSRADIIKQGQRWVENAGAVVITDGEAFGVEVSPLISYTGENLEFLSGREIKAPAILEREE